MQTSVEKIWNRACGFGVNTVELLSGDIALKNMITFHSLAMNGGVLHAIVCEKDATVALIAEGYRWLGLDAVSEFMQRAHEQVSIDRDMDLLEVLFNQEYERLIPDDAILYKCFEDVLRAKPMIFALA